MSRNTTDRLNATYVTRDRDSGFQTAVYVYSAGELFNAVVGVVLNLWFLVAILRSQEMRSRLRNKIICNTFVLNLLDSALILPINAGTAIRGNFYSCAFYSSVGHLRLIQDFIANWLLVMLIVVYIAQIQDFNPTIMLTPRISTLGTFVLLVFPWVASVVLVPVIVHEYYNRLPKTYMSCSYPTRDAMEIFKSVDTAVPIILAIILVIVAGFLRYRRLSRGNSAGSMQTELLGRGPEIDNILAYITAVAISTVCDLLRLIFALNVYSFTKFGWTTWLWVMIASMLATDTRVSLMPLPWLLLTDIRQRIKTWRPWYSPIPGFDLTVTYKKEES